MPIKPEVGRILKNCVASFDYCDPRNLCKVSAKSIREKCRFREFCRRDRGVTGFKNSWVKKQGKKSFVKKNLVKNPIVKKIC